MSTLDNGASRVPPKWKPRFTMGGRKNSKGSADDNDPEESKHSISFGAKKNSNQKPKGGGMIRKLKSLSSSFRKDREDSNIDIAQSESSQISNPQSPYSQVSYMTVESELEEKKSEPYDFDEGAHRRAILFQKQRLKERDGFCRRVDTYDGQVIVVDQKPTYEIGNYLGGGVAGVVYEGIRLLPLEEYPIRRGINDSEEEEEEQDDTQVQSPEADGAGFFCSNDLIQGPVEVPCGEPEETELEEETAASPTSATLPLPPKKKSSKKLNPGKHEEAELAIEATINHDAHGVMLDSIDAPSRSKTYAKVASVTVGQKGKFKQQQQKSLEHGLTEEAVAIKILNPVGYRILQAEGLKGSVVVKKGDAMDPEVKKGTQPMEERHVWWLVNPNSRNLRTLQRYNGKEKGSGPKGVQVDRGSKKKGLRLSLIAAYIDPKTELLRELTLTRCIEIWGHIPFNATDVEFEDMMTAIERVNAGQPPPPVPSFGKGEDRTPGRVGTDVTSSSNGDDMFTPMSLKNARTGLLRAALTPRTTVHCEELNAYIAIPAVPSKYLRWLRQRRAATKEIRNMMSIGRHKNVLHLFEVLEYIQDSKSTMFLILELVKGGELFDLISSSAGKNRKSQQDTDEAEKMMRRFFYELASGIHYCHKNGIAHRDLKPENLLVHNGPDGEAILKIADFGLSAAFGPNVKNSDFDAMDSMASPLSQTSAEGSAFSPFPDPHSPMSPMSQTSNMTIKESVDKIIASGASALSYLTCGAVETVLCIPNLAATVTSSGPAPLRRMTSVVGSPHYVAPEIISQTEEKNRKGKGQGYDGAKADVWSAGVILYAMLFRSLPFGEDLLRCPRFQSYRKWYDEVRELGGRRSSAVAALYPHISESEERDFLGPHWFFPATTSKESRDLIVAMLNPKPEDRLSVDQVLQHPWVIEAMSG